MSEDMSSSFEKVPKLVTNNAEVKRRSKKNSSHDGFEATSNENSRRIKKFNSKLASAEIKIEEVRPGATLD